MSGTTKSAMRVVIAVAALVLAHLAPAVAQGPYPGDLPAPMPDGRMLGHLPYPEALPGDLLSAPPGFAIGQPCLIHRDAAPDLTRMLAAAAIASGVGRTLRAVSCFRSVAHQRGIFCRYARPGVCYDPAGRARFVGPPGYSEHATGYAIDFGARPSPGCADVNACIAVTPAGRWLLAHAPEYGFELSFPPDNAQGVTWEPWHWRWVGANVNALGAARARLAFARARTTYPGSPRVEDVSDVWLTARPVASPSWTPAPVPVRPVTVRPPPVRPTVLPPPLLGMPTIRSD